MHKVIRPIRCIRGFDVDRGVGLKNLAREHLVESWRLHAFKIRKTGVWFDTETPAGTGPECHVTPT
jgi:hypothetical protein